MKMILILAVVLGVIYYFGKPTIESIGGKVSGRYNSNVEEVHELSN